MKSKIKLILLFLLLFSLFLGCSRTPTNIVPLQPNDSSPNDIIVSDLPSNIPATGTEILEPDDNTISKPAREPFDFSLDRTTGEYFSLSDLSDRTLEKTISSNLRLSAAFNYRTPEALSPVSPVVVIGEVQDVYYRDTWAWYFEEGDIYVPTATAVTFYDVQITQVLRGDYVIGDVITIADDGGYMRGEVYTEIGLNYPEWINSSHYVQYEHYGSAQTLEAGSSYVFFLQEHRFYTPESYDIASTPFEFVGGFTGVYSISADNNVSRHMQNSAPWTYGTLDELISAVAKNPFDQTKYDEIYK